MVELTIYDTKEDWINDCGQRSYYSTEEAARNYIKGYGECYEYYIRNKY